MNKKVKKEESILEDIKKIEKSFEEKLLREAYFEIKKIAKEILELDERINALLESIGRNKNDAKKVKDYVNCLDDVVLKEFEKDKIRKDMWEKVNKIKEKIKEK